MMGLLDHLQALKHNGKTGGLFFIAVLLFFMLVLFWQVVVAVAVGWLALWLAWRVVRIIAGWFEDAIDRHQSRRH